ncbi:hypothetical protein QJQ45_007832 [Haematococcus lacustris]|nr:hypothetical protein QJQ45_007832 [Haematococcus lacustris]
MHCPQPSADSATCHCGAAAAEAAAAQDFVRKQIELGCHKDDAQQLPCTAGPLSTLSLISIPPPLAADHRGTPEAPGRTVTLEAAAGARTWGVAWELDGDLDTQLATLQYLEVREKQYDVQQLVEVWGRPGQLDAPASLPPPPSTQPPSTPNAPSPMDTLMPATSGQVTQPAEHGLLLQRALCYIASPANPNWLGPTTHAQLVAQVSTACGPSGPNYEYVTRLAAAMRLMGVDDPELFRLEADLRLTCPAAAAAPPT